MEHLWTIAVAVAVGAAAMFILVALGIVKAGK
jgi:hypothetical protein